MKNRERIEGLEKKVKELEERLEELERKTYFPYIVSTPPSETGDPIPWTTTVWNRPGQ